VKAGFLVALVAAAVLVPTALIRSAPATGEVFSVQQVLRVFSRAGVPLSRDTSDYPGGRDETFEGLTSEHDFYLSVSVWRPGFSPPAQGTFVAYTEPPPRFAHRGNVYLALSGPAPARTWSRVLEALRTLRYSRTDASRPQLPTFVLHTDEQRTLTEREAPNGSEVDCTNGFVGEPLHRDPVAASIAIAPSTRASPAFSAGAAQTESGRAKGARLDWSPHGHGSIEFSCSAEAPSEISGGNLPGAGSSGKVVVSGFGTIAALPPSETGPLPPLKLQRPETTLGGEYAAVSAETRRAMLGTR
jgi:hypothetical protein